jgi:hypothetical protein
MEAVLAPVRGERGRPVLLVVGGADGMDEAAAEAVGRLARDVIGPAVVAADAAVVDGGTDTGVMRLLGLARQAADGAFALVGVAPVGRVGSPASVPEPNHSLVLAVPGDAWGDESPWLLPVARAIARGLPVVLMLLNGGDIARREALAAVAEGVRTIVVGGSGRAADDLASTWRSAGASAPAAVTLASLAEPGPLTQLLGDALAGRQEGTRMTSPTDVPAAASPSTGLRSDATLGSLIAALPLTETQRQIIAARWLAQMEWMGDKAREAQRRYHVLRLTTVIGGVIVPAMVSISLGQTTPEPLVRWATFVLSLLVAVSAAVEGFFHHGDRWRHYRGTAELLKSEGWQFLTGVGAYRRHEDLDARYAAFIDRVEDILRQDVEGYLTEVAATKASERHDVFTRV